MEQGMMGEKPLESESLLKAVFCRLGKLWLIPAT